MRPKLYQVYPTSEYTVYLYYDNGEIKLYDCKWILEEDGIFSAIQNPNDFVRLCVIMNNTLAFDITEKFDPYSCIDICPDTIYEESIPSKDILVA